MRRTARIKDHVREKRLYTDRAFITAITVGVMLLGIILRLFWLEVVRHSYYTELSQGNRVRLEALNPDRGLIYDRSGTVIAENTPAYQLELTPEQVPNVPETLNRLAALGLIEPDQVPALRRLIRAGRKFEAIPLRLSLSDVDIAKFAARQHDFPGVALQTRLARWYPFGSVGAHMLGYVAAISEEDLNHMSTDEYAGSSVIGKIGLENTYEQQLHGTTGFQQILVNAQGRHVDRLGGTTIKLSTKQPSAGSDLFLGLDMRIQQIAEEALAGHRGALIALDPMTGDVIALASVPSFDPNKFTRGISTHEYAQLRDDPNRPLFNRALRGTYPPGSTVKPLMALAGLEYGAIEPSTSRLCRGYYTLPGSSHEYRDWKKDGHGAVDMRRAIATSCDVYFYGLAETLGIDRMHDAMVNLGFGKLTGIDVTGEHVGLMPSPEWKRQTYKQNWFPGETVIVGIGQGYLLATPLQLAHATAILAARGKNFRPRLVTAIRDATTREIKKLPPIEDPAVVIKNSSNWEVIVEGMEMATEAGGTAAAGLGHGASYRIAAKTGTAQVFSLGQNEKYNANDVDEKLRDHALFVAFAPAEAPKIVVAILVENGGHGGTVAAPIARRIFDAYLLGDYGQQATKARK